MYFFSKPFGHRKLKGSILPTTLTGVALGRHIFLSGHQGYGCVSQNRLNSTKHSVRLQRTQLIIVNFISELEEVSKHIQMFNDFANVDYTETQFVYYTDNKQNACYCLCKAY